MNENETMSLKNFKELVASLTSAQDYHCQIETIRSCLGLPLPNAENKKHKQIEALLITMTKIYYQDIRADIVLVALGLLKDFDNRNDNPETKGTDSEKYLLTKRHIKFLRESSYLEITSVNGNVYHTYENLEQNSHNLKTALNTLGTKDKRYIKKVAEKLYENRNSLEEYISESQKYINEKDGELVLETLENQRTASYGYEPPQGNKINATQGGTDGKILKKKKKKKKKKGKVHVKILTAYGTMVNIKGHQTKKMMGLIKDISTGAVISLSFAGIITCSWKIFQHICDYNALKGSQDINFTAEAPKNNTPIKGDKPERWDPSPDNSYNEENDVPVEPLGNEEEGLLSMSIKGAKLYSIITDNATELVYAILGDAK